jgi:hypothetical protein
MSCIGALIVAVVCAAIACVLGAVLIGTTNAWFLDAPFIDGWHAAWETPWKLLVFTIFIAPFLTGD